MVKKFMGIYRYFFAQNLFPWVGDKAFQMITLHIRDMQRNNLTTYFFQRWKKFKTVSRHATFYSFGLIGISAFFFHLQRNYTNF